ncbi:MAG: hypothetical protein K6F66_06330 [Pseudobutyrivibrio sp.]|nr:hypothetical protein [Pseudobutyrivibrio sp.]
MRFKYYLRGIGIGIILATCLLSISFYFGKDNLGTREMTDAEIIQKATELGMVEAPKEDEEDSEDSSKEELKDEAASEETAKEDAKEDITLDEAIDEASSDTESETEADDVVTYIPFSINSGESSDSVASKLYNAGLVDSASEFNSYMNELGVDSRIQSGTFYVKEGSSYDDLISLLVNKDTRSTTPPEE